MFFGLREAIGEAVYQGLRIAAIRLPPDVRDALRRAYENETSPAARSQLEAILRNIEAAERLSKPLCQDTGLITFYVEIGRDFPLPSDLREILVEATRRATREIPLRPNAVNPFTGHNTGDNTGRLVPYIHYELVEGDKLTIHIVPKGGGSETVSVLRLPRRAGALRRCRR